LRESVNTSRGANEVVVNKLRERRDSGVFGVGFEDKRDNDGG
jgi:hypothetical protein